MPREPRRTAAALALLAALAAPAGAEDGDKVLRFVPQSSVTAFDPVWTTTYMARNHGYLVWDTLFGTDSAFRPQPQMLESWSLSADQRTWRLTLRPGLTFHDGQPVRPQDCIASIRRWGARDPFGQALMAAVETMTALDARSFEIRLAAPFPRLPEALGKLSSNVPFMMPERLALTDPFQQIPDYVGSGPFVFDKDALVPGSRVVYRRNPDYRPRPEPADWSAGGKVARVDRVEWHIMPDPATAVAALEKGEVDWLEQPLTDLLPLLRRNPDVRVLRADPLGALAMMVFNHQQPPFDKPALRQAVLGALDQSDYLRAMMGNDETLWRRCAAFFACGSASESSAGSEALTGPRDLAAARRAIAAAGYRGERIVLLSPTDFPVIHSQSLVTLDLFRKLGLNAELVAADWAAVTARRASKEPVEKGGWSVLHTWFGGADLTMPATHPTLRGSGPKAWFGWPDAPRLEALREAWLGAPDAAQQRIAIDALQREAWQVLPFVPIGQFFNPIAIRRELSGVIEGPIAFFWNVDKAR